MTRSHLPSRCDSYHPHNDNLVSRLWLFLQAVAFVTEAHATSQHNYLVIGIFFSVLLMFKCQQRTGYQRLPELVAKVACTIGSLCQNLFRCLVEPLANREDVFPVAELRSLVVFILPIVDRLSCKPLFPLSAMSGSAAHSVSDFTTRTGCRTVERLNCRRKVMCFSFQGNHTLNGFYAEEVGCTLICRRKLFNFRTLSKCHIIFICGKNLAWILLCCLFNHGKEAALHYLAIDNKLTSEYFVSAVLRVDLCEAEHFRVGQWASILLLYLVQVLYFLR